MKKIFENIKAVGFDVDGTLYHTPPEMSGWIGRELIARAAKRLGKEPDEIADEYLEKREKYRSNTLTLNSFGLPGEEIFQDLWDKLPIEKYVKRDLKMVETVQELSKKYRLFVISNGHGESIKKKLTYLGIDVKLFDPFIAGYDHGWVKPEPAPFLAAIEATQLKPAEIVYVGDREDIDIDGARAVGMKTIFVGGEYDQADYSSDTVYELGKILL